MENRSNRLSYSRISNWYRCRYAYHMQWTRGLVPRVAAQPLRRGILIHAGLESALHVHFLGIRDEDELMASTYAGVKAEYEEWADSETIKPLLEENSQLWDEAIETRDNSIMIAARAVRELGLASDRWETLVLDEMPLIEYNLEQTLASSGIRFEKFEGRLDWVARDKETGHAWLMDFKTRKQMQPIEADETNLQFAIYQHLLGLRGIKLNGTATYQIRAAVPKDPKVNKNGSISRAACATNWETYERAVLSAGLDPYDYIEMKDKFSDFQRLDFTYRTEKEVESLWEGVMSTVADLSRDSLPVYRSMNTFNCRGCAYKEHCMESLRGGDVEFIEKTQLMKAGEEAVGWLDMEEENEDD